MDLKDHPIPINTKYYNVGIKTIVIKEPNQLREMEMAQNEYKLIGIDTESLNGIQKRMFLKLKFFINIEFIFIKLKFSMYTTYSKSKKHIYYYGKIFDRSILIAEFYIPCNFSNLSREYCYNY